MFMIVSSVMLISENSYRITVVFIGLMLISVSILALYGVGVWSELAKSMYDKEYISEDFYNDFKHKSHIFLYVLPFVTAGLGTNLISDAITKKIHYKESPTLLGMLKGVYFFPKGIVLTLLFVIVVFMLPFLMLFDKTKQYIPVWIGFIRWANRSLLLKLLKLDILYRNYKYQKFGNKINRV
jgi:hypothetical protein